MKARSLQLLILCGTSLLVAAAAVAHEPAYSTEFDRERCTFITAASHPYFPLWPGYGLLLKGPETNEDGEVVQITSAYKVLTQTELVDGVSTRVIEHREWEDDELIEVTRDYHAVCRETGAVWYFGEDVDEYQDGKIVGHTGAWRAGVNGATAGIFMLGTPVLGARYHQELAPGVAEDRAEVIELHAEVAVPAGTYHGVLEILDTTPLEPGVEDSKFYAPGVGMIQDATQKLLQITPPPCLPESTVLCLNHGRFRVRAQWKDFQGAEGVGIATAQSDDSGQFWFFGPSNTELLVKVLDACPLPEFRNLWVFAAGLTNVDVTLTVTDTMTGQVKVYNSPLGKPFEPILDTAAFANCR